jgi:glycosyltransferase involved in cell wall biosynthesis
MRVTFCYKHLAPYHHARLQALQRLADVTVLEYGNLEGAAFAGYEGGRHYRAIRLGSCQRDADALMKALDETAPDVLLLPGWGYPYVLSALAWALDRSVPAVVISDSTEIDKSRKRYQEAIKARVIRYFSAGLVAGKRSREYLVKLGMQNQRIFEGCDIIDNGHFEKGAQAARNNENSFREKLGLPQNYFLSVNRLIPEKNLLYLLRAYHGYRSSGAPCDWHLVLVGGGKLRGEILRCRSELSLESHVLLAGQKSYEELPSYYGLANAFILASTAETWGLTVNEAMAVGLPVLVSKRCGCADDLIEEGTNGYTFDPSDIDALTDRMLEMAGGEYDLNAMGEAGRKIISRWTVEFCAENTLKAAETAMTVPRPKANVMDKFFLRVVQRRLSGNI